VQSTSRILISTGSACGVDTAWMDLRHLRTFEAVARTGSFTAAAAELAYTQSAVSQHISALEATVRALTDSR
jgi:molybdenum-dependent DNA-binding transcriptional regulator ModE